MEVLPFKDTEKCPVFVSISAQICIHACVNGFSRLNSASQDPKFTSSHRVGTLFSYQALKDSHGLPSAPYKTYALLPSILLGLVDEHIMNLSGKTSEGALVRTAEERLPSWSARLAEVKSMMSREEAEATRSKQTPTTPSIPEIGTE